jgi:hypothetical protein
MVKMFDCWREEKMGPEPIPPILNTHNFALTRIFDVAVTCGYMKKVQIPALANKGRDNVRRIDLNKERYATLIRKLFSWLDARREVKSRDMCHLLRD